MISFSEVKQQIAELQALYACEMHRLTDKVSCAYWQLALADLDTILSSTEDESQRIDKLKEFLADQWQTIYNNSFCYTAYPNSDYTQLICAIAQKITAFINKENDGTDENRRPVGVVKILMPGIKTENLYQAGDNEWSTETSHLRPMWLKDQNRWQDIDIRIILNTHIVSQDGKSLIPLSVLEEVNSYVAHSELYKPYCYEGVRGQEPEVINAEERVRLEQHSSATQSVFDAQKDWVAVTSDSSNLLTQLEILIDRLIFNSENVTGTGKNAGEGAIQAVLNFKSYYKELNNEKVPAEVKKAIEEVFQGTIDLQLLPHQFYGMSEEEWNAKKWTDEELAKFKRENPDLGVIRGNCIDLAQRNLSKAIMQHRVALAAISIDGQQKDAQIKEAKKRLDEAKAALMQKLRDETYLELDSHDHLPISINIANTLAVTLNLNSPQEICVFSSEELTYICENQRWLEAIYKVIRLSRNFEMFLWMANPQKIKTVMHKISEVYPNFFLPMEQRIGYFAKALDLQRCEALFSGSAACLLAMETKLHLIIEDLTPERKAILIKALKAVKEMNLKTLSLIPAAFTPEETKSILLEELAKFPEQTRRSIMTCMNELPEYSLELMLAISYPQPDGRIVEEIVTRLRPKSKVLFIKAIKPISNRYIDLIHRAYPLDSKQTAEEQLAILEEIESNFIEESQDFIGYYNSLPMENAKYFYIQVMWNRLPTLINSCSVFHQIFKELPQRFPYRKSSMDYFVIMHPTFSNLTHTFADFITFYNTLSSVKGAETYLNHYVDAMQNRLPQLLSSLTNLKRFTHLLGRAEGVTRQSLLRAYGYSNLHSIENLKTIEPYLSADEKKEVFPAIETSIEEMTLSWQDAAVISSFIQGDISVNVYIENVVDRFSAPPDSVENYSLSSDYKNNEDYQRLAVLLPRLSIANRNTVLTALGYPGMRFMPVFREMYTALTNDELVAFYQENRTTLIENMTTVDDCLALTDMFSHLDEIDLLPVMSATLKVRLGDKRIFKDLIFNLLAIKNGDRVLALIGYPLFETTTQMSRCYRLVQQWGEQSHVTATEYFALIKEELYRRVFAGTIKDFFNGLWITYEENNSQEYTLANRRKFLLWGNTEEALSQLCSTLEFPGKNELLRKYGNLPKRITLPIIVEQLFSDLDKMEDPASEESIALVNSIYSAVDSETLVSVLLNRCFDFDKMRRDFNGCTEDNQAKLVSWLFEGEKRGLVTIRSCYDMAKTEKVRMMFRDEIIQSSNNAGVAFDRLQELGFKKEYFISYLQDNLFRDRDHHSRSGTSPLEELITKLSLEHRRYYQDILLPRINELYGLKTQIEKIVEYLQQSVGENTLDDKKFAEHVAQVSWYLREGPVEANLFFQFIMALFLNDNQKRIASSACERVLEDLKNQSDPTVTKVLIENELFRYVKFRVASAASREAIWKIAQDIKKIGNIVDLGKHIMFDIEDFLYDGLMRDKLRMPLLDAIEHLFPLFIYRCRYNDRRFFAGKLLAVLNAENWQKIFEIVDINAYLYDKFIPGMLLKRSDLCQIFPTEEAIKMFLSKHAANYSGCGMGDLRAQFMKKWVETFQKEYARQSGNSSISFFEDPYLWWRGKDMTAQDILKYAQENPRSNIAKVISPSRSSVMKGKQSVAA